MRPKKLLKTRQRKNKDAPKRTLISDYLEFFSFKYSSITSEQTALK